MRFRRAIFPDDRALLVSGFGEDTGGGLFAIDDRGIEQLDTLSSTGLTFAEGRLVRLLRAPESPGYGSELLLYDERGVLRYLRLDEVDDPHDVLWDDSSIALVSTTRNAIVWLSPGGEVLRRWQAPGEGDAWHLNSLVSVDGDLFAAAFGRFDRHRAWTETETRGTGFVFNVRTEEDVLKGLTCPHHPRVVDGSWLVCNSKDHELVELGDDGETVKRRLRLRGWTRGIESTAQHLFVGESAARDGSAAPERASVAVVSRRRWRLVRRIELPCREVYDLLLVPRALLDGVRRGFRTNPLRTAEQAQHDLFASAGARPLRLWASGEPLPREACRILVEASLPDTLRAGSLTQLDCMVTNNGSAILVSAPPNPVNVSYRWLSGPSDVTLEEGLRAPLPEPLPPGSSMRCRVTLKAPAEPGEYLLRITLVQEQVRWFDEVDELYGWTASARVG